MNIYFYEGSTLGILKAGVEAYQICVRIRKVRKRENQRARAANRKH